MASNDPRLAQYNDHLTPSISPSQVKNLRLKPRVGLMPTDRQEYNYKRSSVRSSKRTPAERRSYLMATGHLDTEELRQLNEPQPGDVIIQSNTNNNVDNYIIKNLKNSINVSNNNNRIDLDANHQQYQDQEHQVEAHTRSNRYVETPLSRTRTSAPPSSSESLFLNTTIPSQFDFQDNSFLGTTGDNNLRPSSKGSKIRIATATSGSNQLKNSISGTSNNNSSSFSKNKNRGHFKQTYTEVPLPMKTSPAFEYILKENKRHHRRCCLWLVYSILVTICIAIILFSGLHLKLRYYDRNNNHNNYNDNSRN